MQPPVTRSRRLECRMRGRLTAIRRRPFGPDPRRPNQTPPIPLGQSGSERIEKLQRSPIPPISVAKTRPISGKGQLPATTTYPQKEAKEATGLERGVFRQITCPIQCIGQIYHFNSRPRYQSKSRMWGWNPQSSSAEPPARPEKSKNHLTWRSC